MSLLKPGICQAFTEEVGELLRQADIRTVKDFITRDPEELSQKCSIPFHDVVAIRRVLLAQYSAFPVRGCDVYDAAVLSTALLSTACDEVDQLLDGGLYTGEVTELAGDIAAGKTQICLSSAACIAHDNKQNVVYIDTSGGFCAERIAKFLSARQHLDESNIELILQRIKCIHVYDIFEMFACLEEIKSHLIKQSCSFYSGLKLVVVDSVASVVYPVLGGQQMDGHGLMVLLGQKLKMLAVDFSLAVLITNNLVSGDGGQRTASLGRTWSHVPHTRLVLQTREDNKVTRRATLVKSPRMLTPLSTDFTISE
ncbi:DNA repair protein RAD51 homolog 4-like [Gigantopelta aegis]|uniref:DNA repair protein RAD51 homolog 4-like n=1 Tax=Gigantopelta aegis TaxID=1735272 RepID=UPI001B888BF9|nr:DNA repair protein RAD51 homolog 4-like [Gigantopelta aegis]